jgi:hypothetical protein
MGYWGMPRTKPQNPKTPRNARQRKTPARSKAEGRGGGGGCPLATEKTRPKRSAGPSQAPSSGPRTAGDDPKRLPIKARAVCGKVDTSSNGRPLPGLPWCNANGPTSPMCYSCKSPPLRAPPCGGCLAALRAGVFDCLIAISNQHLSQDGVSKAGISYV